MSPRSRWEYFRAIYARYRHAERKQKQVILNEFCANPGYHRKYAIRRLNGPPPEPPAAPSAHSFGYILNGATGMYESYILKWPDAPH